MLHEAAQHAHCGVVQSGGAGVCCIHQHSMVSVR